MRNVIIIFMIAVSVGALVLMVGGLVLTISGNFGEKFKTKLDTEPKSEASVEVTTSPPPTTPRPSNQPVRVVALGDSLTRGAGDETNQGGYVGEVVRGLEKTNGQKVILNNVAVDGFKASDLNSLLDDPTLLEDLKKADAILMSIGGNDLHQGGQTLANLSDETVAKLAQAYQSNLRQIMSAIRVQNKTAPLYMIGLYDPFSELTESRETTKYVRQWNEETAELLAADLYTLVVPTFDLYQLEPQTFLAADQFHPNSKGYRLIAERILATLPAAIGGVSN